MIDCCISKNALNQEAVLWTASNVLCRTDGCSWGNRSAPSVNTLPLFQLALYCTPAISSLKRTSRSMCCSVWVWLIAWHLTFLQQSSAPLSCLSVNVKAVLAKGLLSAGWRQLFVRSLKGSTLSVCPKRPSGHRLWLSVRADGSSQAEYNLFYVSVLLHVSMSSLTVWHLYEHISHTQAC